MPLHVKPLRLLIQQEAIPMRRAKRRRARRRIVRNERLRRSGDKPVTPVSSLHQARLQPVQDRSQKARRRVRRVGIQADDHVLCLWIR